MSWNEASVLRAGKAVGKGGTLWILYLAGNYEVGVEKTSDYHTLRSSVRTYAQNEGLDDPGHPTVREGYKNISRKKVIDADGNRDAINNEHKPHIVSLTSLGKSLMSTVHHNDAIRHSLKESIGIEMDDPPDPWWPGEGPRDSFSVVLQTYEDRSVQEQDSAEIEAEAFFDCPYCEQEIENEFTVELQDGYIVDGWNEFPEASCDNCENTFRHSAADPHHEPEPL